jgi:hypothetical protein
MLEKNEETIKTRDTGTIWYARHRAKTNTQNTED